MVVVQDMSVSEFTEQESREDEFYFLAITTNGPERAWYDIMWEELRVSHF